jgi:hypothetical protein
MGLIWPMNARDGRSTAGGGLRGGEIIGEAKQVKWARGKRFVVLAVRWRSSRATLI